MYSPMSPVQTLYEADASIMNTVKQCKERIHLVCQQHMNRRVQINTVHGQSFEGMIVGYDDHYLYLDISVSLEMRPPYPVPYPVPYNPYYSTILPLVLFELLTISLL